MTLDARRLLTTIEGRACSDLSRRVCPHKQAVWPVGSSLASTPSMTFLMHWSFKTGYHEIAAKKFLATGAPFPECKSWKRWHAPGSVEGWILVEADNADACYEHAAEWAECLDWEVTPVLSDEQAGPLIAKAYS